MKQKLETFGRIYRGELKREEGEEMVIATVLLPPEGGKVKGKRWLPSGLRALEFDTSRDFSPFSV